MENNNLKICLYLEFYHFWGGFLYKKIGTGFLSSYKNQKKILTGLNIRYVEQWDDSCTILQINTPWLWSLLLIRKARKQNKKVIIWSHVTAEDIQGVFRFGRILSPLAKKYLRYAYGKADVVLAPTEYTKTLLVAYGISASKITVMSNGVDIEKFVGDENISEMMRTRYGFHASVV